MALSDELGKSVSWLPEDLALSGPPLSSDLGKSFCWPLE